MRSVPLHDVSEVQAALAAANLDAAIVISPRNVWCLIGYPMWRWQRPGYRRSAVAIAYRDAPPTLVTGRFQEEISLIRAWVRDVTTYGDYVESPLARAAEFLHRRQLAAGRIGIESQYLTAEFADDLTRGLAEDAEVVPCDDVLAGVWAAKQPAERERMGRNAEQLASLAAGVVAEARAGESEAALHKRMLAAIRHAGGAEGWGRTVSGERLGLAAALPSDRALRAGDLVSLEYAAAFQMYPARIGRLAVVGEPAAETRQRYERYARTLEQLSQQVGPGQEGREIFDLARRVFAAEGLALRGSSVGNALGIGYYERPALQPQETLRTVPGMVVTLEPETSDGLKASCVLEITEEGAARLSDGLPPLSQLLRITA